jgi:hypothetical protein
VYTGGMMAINSDTLRQRADQIRTSMRQVSDPGVVIKLAQIAAEFDRLAAYVERVADGVIIGAAIGRRPTTSRRG